ncbi:PAS domain-containing protein [Halorubrum gandharaense]
MEDALREREERFRQLAEHIQEIVWMSDPESEELIYVNPAYEAIWGRSAESLYEDPTSFVDGIHHEDRPRVEEALAAHANGEYDETYRIIRPDGELRWVHDRAVPIENDAGEVYRVVGITSDITEQKERERELRETKRRLDLVLEGTNTGIWEWKIGTGEIEWNETLERALGLEPGSFEGTYEAFTKRVHPDDLPEVEEELTQAIETDDLYHLEFRMIHEDGHTVWAECPGVIVDQDDEPDWMVGLHRDITERKRREERLERFAAIVSHDLRNPLTVASGYLELAQEDCKSDSLDRVEKAHDRMASLIENLLTLTRDGDTVDETESVELREIIEKSWENVMTAEAVLTADLDCEVRADRSRLQQLLENLLRNAVEHGGADVTVTVGRLENGFYVEDDGPGIPEGDHDDVFEAGYSTAEGGTGFGLNIVKQVAEAHDWKVRVTDGAEGGARFEITGVECASE